MPKNTQTTTQFALISHTSKVMLKILQERFHQYINWELPDVQAGFKKGRGMRYQIANIHWIIEKGGEIQKKHLLWVYWLCQSIWLCESQQTAQNSSRDGNTRPPDLPLEKPVSEATVRTGHGTTDLYQIGKGVHQGCILSPCLFILYAEYIMLNPRLEEAQTRIKIVGRNISNLRYVGGTTLIAESEEPKSLLMKVKGEWKNWLENQH